MIQVVLAANLNFKWKPAHLLTLHLLLFPSTFFSLLFPIYFKSYFIGISHGRTCSKWVVPLSHKPLPYFSLCNSNIFSCLPLLTDRPQKTPDYVKKKWVTHSLIKLLRKRKIPFLLFSLLKMRNLKITRKKLKHERKHIWIHASRLSTEFLGSVSLAYECILSKLSALLLLGDDQDGLSASESFQYDPGNDVAPLSMVFTRS